MVDLQACGPKSTSGRGDLAESQCHFGNCHIYEAIPDLDNPAPGTQAYWAGSKLLEETTRMRTFVHKLCLGLLLVAPMAAFSQSDAKDDMKKAGEETKDAAKDTGKATKKAAKKTGHAVKKTTKKVTHKAAKATRKGAEKVEDKTAQ